MAWDVSMGASINSNSYAVTKQAGTHITDFELTENSKPLVVSKIGVWGYATSGTGNSTVTGRIFEIGNSENKSDFVINFNGISTNNVRSAILATPFKIIVGKKYRVYVNVNNNTAIGILYNSSQTGVFNVGIASIAYNISADEYNYKVPFYLEVDQANATPTINLTKPTNNQTLYENSTLTMAGNTTDIDIDDVVTIKYQIDSGTVRNLHSAVSDGSTPINFSRALTYKDGVLYDGANAITSVLDKDVPHTVSVWAEDGKGGKSTIVTRTFFVVPNRPPSITVHPIAAQSDLINSNVINVSGAVTDLDNNDVTVKFAINGGEEQLVHQGPPSAFTFNILLADLKVGANTVIVKATDVYNTSGTKTLTINKTHNAVPVNTAVARYAIQAPTGSAKSILLWINRTLGNLGITAEISLTTGTEAENYVELTKTNSAVVNGQKEEEYAYQGTVEKEKIILKITYDRTDASVVDTIKQISGVLF